MLRTPHGSSRLSNSPASDTFPALQITRIVAGTCSTRVHCKSSGRIFRDEGIKQGLLWGNFTGWPLLAAGRTDVNVKLMVSEWTTASCCWIYEWYPGLWLYNGIDCIMDWQCSCVTDRTLTHPVEWSRIHGMEWNGMDTKNAEGVTYLAVQRKERVTPMCCQLHLHFFLFGRTRQCLVKGSYVISRKYLWMLSFGAPDFNRNTLWRPCNVVQVCHSAKLVTCRTTRAQGQRMRGRGQEEQLPPSHGAGGGKHIILPPPQKP